MPLSSTLPPGDGWAITARGLKLNAGGVLSWLSLSFLLRTSCSFPSYFLLTFNFNLSSPLSFWFSFTPSLPTSFPPPRQTTFSSHLGSKKCSLKFLFFLLNKRAWSCWLSSCGKVDFCRNNNGAPCMREVHSQGWSPSGEFGRRVHEKR